MNKLIPFTDRLAALFVIATFATALNATPTVTNVQVPLSGTVFVPLSDGSLDTVALTGMVHVQTTYTPISHASPYWPHAPIQIHFNLDQVFGVGATTGLQYNATGSNGVVYHKEAHPRSSEKRALTC